MGTETHKDDRNTPEYLAQLLKDKKQIQALPNVFIHAEKILDEEINRVRLGLFHHQGKREMLDLPEPAGPVVQLQTKLFVPVKEHPDIAHMISFIEQESLEKSEEIDAKGEEEFNLEKGRLVQTARAKIIDYYDKKIKQVELQKKIQQSNLLNNSRLQILKRKEELLNELLEDARKIAAQVPTQDPPKYRETLMKLALQGLVQLLEPKVTIRVIQRDQQLLQSLVPELMEKYRQITKGKQVIITVDENSFLHDDLIGGCVLLCHGDKITVDNTLDERLKLISNKMQPQIREMLFGPNPNRKFKD